MATEKSAAENPAGSPTGRPGGLPGQESPSAGFALVEETVRRVEPAAGDHPVDSSGAVLAALAELRRIQDQLQAWEPLLIGAARERGASWAAIAPALGVASRQAAERRFLRLNPHATDPDGMTGEQRVQAARDRRAGDRAVAQWARDNAARLRRLAAQITAIDDLDPAGRRSVDRVMHALGDDDTARLLGPLTEAGAQLKSTHPKLAGEVADINTTTDQLRTGTANRPPR